jgi:hypothetical protein
MKNQFPTALFALALCVVQTISINQAASARGGGGHGGSHSGGHVSVSHASHDGGGTGIHGSSHGHGRIAREQLRFYRTICRRHIYIGPYGRYYDYDGNELTEADLGRLYNAGRVANTHNLYANGAPTADIVHEYKDGIEIKSKRITIKTYNPVK